MRFSLMPFPNLPTPEANPPPPRPPHQPPTQPTVGPAGRLCLRTPRRGPPRTPLRRRTRSVRSGACRRRCPASAKVLPIHLDFAWKTEFFPGHCVFFSIGMISSIAFLFSWCCCLPNGLPFCMDWCTVQWCGLRLQVGGVVNWFRYYVGLHPINLCNLQRQ